MSLSNPYCLCVVFALHSCCPCHIRIASVSHPCANSRDMRIWHGCDAGMLRTSIDRDGQVIMVANSIRVWCDFDTDLIRTARMQHGCGKDSTYTTWMWCGRDTDAIWRHGCRSIFSVCNESFECQNSLLPTGIAFSSLINHAVWFTSSVWCHITSVFFLIRLL